MTQFNDDESLVIQLLHYSTTVLTESFYLLEMSTLQATVLLPSVTKIVSAKIVAYTNDNKYLDKNTIDNFKTIGEFNEFFLDNPDYYIHDCEIELGNGVTIRSHDDGEVSIQFPGKNSGHDLVDSIFRKYNLDTALIRVLKTKPGYYISIDKDNNVTGEFESFDEYLSSRK